MSNAKFIQEIKTLLKKYQGLDTEVALRAQYIISNAFELYEKEIEEIGFESVGKARDFELSYVEGVKDLAKEQLSDGTYIMAHTYPRNINSSLPGNNGILRRKSSTYTEGPSHLVEVVDLIRNEDGEVIFLVVKNSWGSGNGYKGYEFLHRSLFEDTQVLNRYSLHDVELIAD